MKFVISGGGTAGHIYPAIAVGRQLESMGHEVFFAGTPSGLEARLAPEAGFPFEAFDVSGFNRSHPATLIKSSMKALKGSSNARKWLKSLGADAVIGFGGYVSIPVGKAAGDLGIPLVIHEQNSACGMANKYLAPHATRIALTYDVARKDLKTKAPIELTGNPVRPELLEIDPATARSVLRVPDDAELLFVFGGSLGARHINTGICKLAGRLLERPNLHIIHVAGPKEYDTVLADLEALGIEPSGPGFSTEAGWENPGRRYMLTGYFNNMGEALSTSDLVVCRAGATTLAEITAIGVPAFLVPYPHATDDHQTKNAQALVESGASLMCADSEVEGDWFAETLFELLDDGARRDEMRELTRKLGRANAAQTVAEMAIAAAEAGR